jgi:hypothetical protein
MKSEFLYELTAISILLSADFLVELKIVESCKPIASEVFG